MFGGLLHHLVSQRGRDRLACIDHPLELQCADQAVAEFGKAVLDQDRDAFVREWNREGREEVTVGNEPEGADHHEIEQDALAHVQSKEPIEAHVDQDQHQHRTDDVNKPLKGQKGTYSASQRGQLLLIVWLHEVLLSLPTIRPPPWRQL